LFAGSDSGAEHWAVTASLFETAKLKDVDPPQCLIDVLTTIIDSYPNSNIYWLPP